MAIKPEDEPVDAVEEASRESFPASDPPAWTLGVEAHAAAMEVSNNVAESRFEAELHGAIAYLQYRRTPQDLTLIHTEVPAELAGKGLGSKLARAALAFAREQGLRVVSRCPFVTDYIQRHPEYADLLRTRA